MVSNPILALILAPIAHLFGDYVLQSHVMAIRKTSSWLWALIHACFYGLPFLLLVSEPWQWAVIVGTHAFIDRLSIARRWCELYGVGFPGLWWRPAVCTCGHRLDYHFTGIVTIEGSGPLIRSEHKICGAARCECPTPTPIPFPEPPPFILAWLVIIVDNTMHLAINAAVLL